MNEERFLVVRLGSLGDIVHTLPAVAALRDAFPGARLDWVVERQWLALLEGNPDLSNIITLNRAAWGEVRACVKQLRAAQYTCAIDFQGLYKSALLARFSDAPRRVGFARRFAREHGATFFYTQRVSPVEKHIVEQNLALARAAGAQAGSCRFSLSVSREADAEIGCRLADDGIENFIVVSPGGGWLSKCWPAERYGQLCRELEERRGWRVVVNHGPGERELAEAVCRAAAPSRPAVFSTDLAQLMALLRRAACVIAGDTGPLHLAVALGTPVVGLYGPTDPERNGPYSTDDVVIRNARLEETSYKRGHVYSPAMLSISVEQVIAAAEKRLSLAAQKTAAGERQRGAAP